MIQCVFLIRNQRGESCQNNKEGEPARNGPKPPSDVSKMKIVDIELAEKEN